MTTCWIQSKLQKPVEHRKKIGLRVTTETTKFIHLVLDLKIFHLSLVLHFEDTLAAESVMTVVMVVRLFPLWLFGQPPDVLYCLITTHYTPLIRSQLEQDRDSACQHSIWMLFLNQYKPGSVSVKSPMCQSFTYGRWSYSRNHLL